VVHAILQWYSVEIAPRTAGDFDDRMVPLLSRVADIIVYSFAFLVIWDALVSILAVSGRLGIGGLAVALHCSRH